jgi:Fur family iron response transcriptional regulator
MGPTKMHRPPQGTLKLSDELSQGNVAKILRGAGLRPTRQRVALAHLLFAEGDRHVTAETLHEEALAKKVPVSLATVYNTLHQFTEAGLLREVAVEGAKTYFDTNTSNHYHFFCEHSGRLLDIATGSIRIEGLPEAPDGMAISRVDVLVRLVDKQSR